MPRNGNANKSGLAERRLTGEDVRQYMESFTEQFLTHKIRYNTRVTNIRKDHVSTPTGKPWVVTVLDPQGVDTELRYDKVVLCTGVSGKRVA